MSFNQLLTDTHKIAKEHNIELHLNKTSFVYCNSLKVNGYFSDSASNGKPRLTVATNVTNWEEIFIHESSHMDQFIEDSKEWQAMQDDPLTAINRFIDGEENDCINSSFDAIIALELDCEKRVISKIKKYNLDINTTEYIQKANAYVLYYRYIQKHKKWYNTKKEPYNLKQVWSQMPTTFDIDYTKLTKKQEQAFYKCFK